MTDFLEEPIARPIPGDTASGLAAVMAAHYDVLCDIRRELMKQNPDVLAITKVQGDNTIATGDEDNHRVYFEIGGKAATAYLLLIHSSYSGNVAVAINSMANQNDGIIFAAGDILVLPITVDSVYVMTDGSADCPINTPSGSADGGLFIYGFTIPDYDRRRDQPLPVYKT